MLARFIPLGLLALTLSVFIQVGGHEFLAYDDPTYIVDNPNLAEGLTVETALRAFREPYETNWIPLTWLSLHVDHALYGLEPAGYLLTNVALHMASVLLLYAALRRMTGAVWRSAFVAAVFAVHPLHVESVAWASERKDTLSGLFWMLTLLAYARYVESPSPLRYGQVALAYCLGLLAKPMLVTLPFVLLLLDYWPLGRLRRDGTDGTLDRPLVRSALLEKIPLLVVAGVVSAITYAVQRDLGAMDHGNALPLPVRIPNALVSYAAYVRDAFWPQGLAVFYPHLERSMPIGIALACGVGIAALCVATLRHARTRPYLLVGWLWYVGTLVPVIGLVQVGMQARADRYTYIPLIGLTLALAWGVNDLVRSHLRLRTVVGAAGIAAVAALAVTAWNQVAHWRNSTTLYAHAVAVTRDNFLAHHGLAGEKLRSGEAVEAELHFREAIRIKRRWPGAHIGLGDALAAQERHAEAIRAYERGLEFGPRHVRGHMQLARALAAEGHRSEALGRYRDVLLSARGNARAETHARIGTLLFEAGDIDGAIAEYRAALALRPELADVQASLGLALAQRKQLGPARVALQEAIALGADAAEIHAALGDIDRWFGDAAGAATHYRNAVVRDPSLRYAANNLAWILATSRDPAVRAPDEAVRIAEGLVRSEGSAAPDPQLLDTLALAYAEAGRDNDAKRTAREALRLAQANGDLALAARIRARLAEYEGRE